MVKNLYNGDVKIVNLFDSIILEVPTFERIENEKVPLMLWQNQVVRNYIDSDEMMLETSHPILTNDEYDDCHSLHYPVVGLLELSSLENTIIDTTIIEHHNLKIDDDDHNINNTDTDDECVIQIIPLITDWVSSFRDISSVYLQSDSKSETMINKLYAKFPQTSALIDKPLDQFNWENAISKESENTSCSISANNYSIWRIPVNFHEKLYLEPLAWYDYKTFYDPILFNLLYKKRKKRDKKFYGIRNGDLFTPEKYLKINDNTAGKYLISINTPNDNYDLLTPIIINCYKKNNHKNNKLHSTMVWQIKIQLQKNRIKSNYHLGIKETLSIPTFLKIQVSDFYTLIPLLIYSHNYNVDTYFWLVFKTTNGEYLGKYQINYDLSVYRYKMQTFRMEMYKNYTENIHLLIPQIIMIGSNLFQINYNWKIIDDELFDNVCCIDNFQLLWIPVVNFLNMINNIEDCLRIDVESLNSIFSNIPNIAFNNNLYHVHSYDNCTWKVVLETPTINTFQPLINIKYPNFELKEIKVYPYFWNNNNIAIKVQYYLGTIPDPNIEIMDGKTFECFILYDIATEKWKFIEINNSITDDFRTLIVDNKLNFVLLGSDSVSIPIYK